MDISTFPLIWRWTHPSHTVLPGDVLAALHPLTTAEIEALHLAAQTRPATLTVKHQVTGDTHETGRWLAGLQLPSGRAVLVWSKDIALSVPWETFVTYWSDFCYPSSDDVDIYIEGGPLVLRWHHDESFEYDLYAHQ